MKKGKGKTNGARQLDQLGIVYELLSYDVDPQDLGADSTAVKLGLPPQQVFKTLVVQGDRRGICLAVIPAHCRLDRKALAHLRGDRTIEPVPLKSVQPLTGYIRGGVTALGCKKSYPVYLDQSAQNCDKIAVSAGQRGLMLWLPPQDYQRATAAQWGAIAQVSPTSDHE